MRILAVLLLLICNSANALSFKEYESIPIGSSEIELISSNRLVPIEVKVRNTDRKYLLACAIYDADGRLIDGKTDFADYDQTRFFFIRQPGDRDPKTAKCIRTQILYPSEDD